MDYFIRTHRKHHFIITPDELRSVLQGFHHVSLNGVARDYIESDPDEFFHNYEKLYHKLKNGDKLIWKQDYQIAAFSTGITQHLENCRYEAEKRLSVPAFLEPCVTIDTFCFLLWNNQLSTSFAPFQFPENVMGFCLSFPSKVEYTHPTEKHGAGIVLGDALDDFITYQHILSGIQDITRPLKLKINEKIHRSTVRISEQAKAELSGTYFFTSHCAQIV